MKQPQYRLILSTALLSISVITIFACNKTEITTPPPTGSVLSTTNSKDYTGDYIRTTKFTDGRLAVVYFNESQGGLELAVEKNRGSRTFSTTLVHESGMILGKHNDLFADTKGTLHVVTHDYTNGRFLYFHSSASAPETLGTPEIIDDGERDDEHHRVGLFGTITGDQEGNLYAVYYDEKIGKPLFTSRSADGEWQTPEIILPKFNSTTTRFSNVDYGKFARIRVNPQGTLYVVCYNESQGDAWLLTRKAKNQDWELTIIDSEGDVGKYADMTLTTAGDPDICYYDASQGNLVRAKPLQGVVSVVDKTGNVGVDCSIRENSHDQACISYMNVDGFDLNLTCEKNPGEFERQELDKNGIVGFYTSMERFGDGESDYTIFYHLVSATLPKIGKQEQKILIWPPAS